MLTQHNKHALLVRELARQHACLGRAQCCQGSACRSSMLSVQHMPEEAGAATSASSDATAEPALERVYERRDATGAPRPLAPALVTLSMLPRPQWQTLVHLDAIQARSRPQQPPQKPAAAPFFLPTVAGWRSSCSSMLSLDNVCRYSSAEQLRDIEQKAPRHGLFTLSFTVIMSEHASLSRVYLAAGVHREPLFDVSAAGTSATDGAQEPQDGTGASRVLVARHGPQRAEPEFLQLLRAGAEAGDFTAFAKHLRGLQPAAIDRELRAMEVSGGRLGLMRRPGLSYAATPLR